MTYCNEEAGTTERLRWLRWVSGAGLVLPFLLAVSPMLSASEATSDVPGSADYDLLERFPRSHIMQYEQESAASPYRLILGSLKKINNVLAPKRSKQIDGRLTRLTYRIPDGNRSDEVSDHFIREVEENDGQVIFHCRGRECGSSNYWANTIFERSVLYGPEQFQNFFVARFIDADASTFVSVYTAQRGNRRLYAHLDVVEANQTEVGADPRSLLDHLRDRVSYLLSGVNFDSTHHLTMDSERSIAVAAAAIKLDESVKIYVVGHLQGAGSLESLVDTSRQRAEQVVTKLIEHGVDPVSISAHGVGPLSPLDNSTAARIELILAE